MYPLAPLDILKLQLLAEGVYIERSARDEWQARVVGPFTLAEYVTTNGVCLKLEGDRYVNAPLALPDEDCTNRLIYQDDLFLVTSGSLSAVAEIVPVAAFHEQTIVDSYDGKSRPMSSYGVTHTDRCRVSPIAGCAWACKFCDLPYQLDYRKKHVDDLLQVINAAIADPATPARHLLVSGGTPRGGTGPWSDLEWMDQTLEELASRSPLPVELMMAGREDLAHPIRMRKAGIKSLSINLEISDPDRARVIMPQKARLGRANFLRYIEVAVEEFGVGAVQSLVVVGSAIESLESALRGIRDLVERGCIPVLSPFRAHHATPLRAARPARFSEVLDTYQATLDICSRVDNGVMPGPQCVACHHNVVALPMEHHFYERPEFSSQWVSDAKTPQFA